MFTQFPEILMEWTWRILVKTPQRCSKSSLFYHSSTALFTAASIGRWSHTLNQNPSLQGFCFSHPFSYRWLTVRSTCLYEFLLISSAAIVEYIILHCDEHRTLLVPWKGEAVMEKLAVMLPPKALKFIFRLPPNHPSKLITHESEPDN